MLWSGLAIIKTLLDRVRKMNVTFLRTLYLLQPLGMNFM